MVNPCNNCQTRWLCTPYGGRCLRKRRYIRKTEQLIKEAFNEKISELENYLNEKIERLYRRIENGN